MTEFHRFAASRFLNRGHRLGASFVNFRWLVDSRRFPRFG